MDKTIEEIWKEIKGFEGRYWVSNTGKIRNVKSALLAQSTVGGGYKQIALYKHGIRTQKRVHQIVAENFVPPFLGEEVNHIDLDKINNNYTNLEWITHKENILHARSCGKFSAKTNNNRSAFHNRNMRKKLNPSDVERIFSMLFDKTSQREIAKVFNVSQKTISRISRGERWKGQKVG